MSKNNFSLAAWREKKLDVAENRQLERTSVDGWGATLFTNATTPLTANVADSCSGGAGLIVSQSDDVLTHAANVINKDLKLTLTINAGFRKFTQQAVVRWLYREHDDIRLGVEFVDHCHFQPGSHQLDIDDISINPACAMRIPAVIAVRRKILPFIELNGIIQVAASGLNNPTMIGSVERMLKAPICTWEVDADKLSNVLRRVYGNAINQPVPQKGKKKDTNEQSESVNLADELLNSAYLQGASDIHIDPTPKGARIRFRVDGQLEVHKQIAVDIYAELTGRLKVMAGLDIAEKRSPQDGRFRHVFPGNRGKVDLRVATLPTRYGERLTLRLLADQDETLTLDKLGFTADHKQMIEGFLQRIQGMMILTGPTGSGKTTTLYTVLTQLLKQHPVNIMTVEDPIEYEIPGAAQTEIDSKSDKVTFNSALRSILRHDPDVVMIGEIRDKETADIAIKAALTGHMVLSTLHTNSAAATVTRLIDMGVEPYLVAAALRLGVAQRLLRRLCKHCRIPRPLTEREALSIQQTELSGQIIYDPVGCIYCANKGYSGRIGLYEIMELRTDWARAVAEGGSEAELVGKMRASGVKSLLQDATDKMLSGETSFDEVLQVASSW